jgi:hypothetical protein
MPFLKELGEKMLTVQLEPRIIKKQRKPFTFTQGHGKSSTLKHCLRDERVSLSSSFSPELRSSTLPRN